MPITAQRITDITTDVVKESFFSYFLGREEGDTRHAVLAKFFPAESIVGSAIVGIATSLGGFWEKLAAKIASENGFEVLEVKKYCFQPVHVPAPINTLISSKHQNRMVPHNNVPMSEYETELKNLIATLDIPVDLVFQKLEKGSGIDLLLKKNNTLYAYDLKTVQLNASGGGLYSERLMKWAAYNAIYQKSKGTSDLFEGHIVIPYDPHTRNNWWDRFGGRVYPLDHIDLKLCNDFWDFISGIQNSFQYIEQAVDRLVTQGYPAIYHPSLRQSDPQQSFNILIKTCNVTAADPDNVPTTFVEKIEWECTACDHHFEKSIRWFEKNRFCPSCSLRFLK